MRYKTFSTNMYTFIKVDLEGKKVVEAGFGYPLFHSSAKRGEENFEEHVIDAFNTLDVRDVYELRRFTETDEILKKVFQMTYQTKLIEIAVYKVDD